MNTLFYHIKKDKCFMDDIMDAILEKTGLPKRAPETETYTYHEFKSRWNGFRGITFGDVYKTFNSYTDALSYAKERGGVDAYSY